VTKQDVYFDVTKSTSETTGFLSLSYTPKFIDVGLTLDVTPQIDDSGNIILNVHPIMSERVGDVATPDGISKIPILDVREVDTIVKVREGETIVIGGLIKNRKLNTDTGTKWLMDIPVVKHFFKLNEKEISKSELVIFLTPRIIYGDTN
jgi:MSHA biogenesis protein MshL